jgi:regulator of protease activity HflC (stomatin/prohibitin superfamily)
MTLEEILRNRNQLSEDILRDVTETAARYGISILRADVKDLVFPGNLQEIMNRVLAAERNSQAQLVEARTTAEVQRIEAQTRADGLRIGAEAETEARRLSAESAAREEQIRTEAEVAALLRRQEAAAAYTKHPALLRLAELEALRDLSKLASARIYIGFDKHRADADSE